MAAATPRSYARAVSATSVATSPPPLQSSSIQQPQHPPQQHPPPTSFTLIAALQASQDITAGQTVYLMNGPTYLTNWFAWALRQPVRPVEEAERVQHELRAAALKLGLVPPPSLSDPYQLPGPVDNTALCVPGHPLVLSPVVQMTSTTRQQQQWATTSVSSPTVGIQLPLLSSASERLSKTIPKRTSMMGHHSERTYSDSGVLETRGSSSSSRRNGTVSTSSAAIRATPTPPQLLNHRSASSSMMMNGKQQQQQQQQQQPSSAAAAVIEAVAVPELFYETLRSVHGVLCEDGRSVSFQRHVGDSERILLHHQQHYSSNSRKQDNNGGAPVGEHYYYYHHHHHHNGNGNHHHSSHLAAAVSRPVEFRRKVILDLPVVDMKREPTTLMEKLLLEEQSMNNSMMVPTVEVHPIKLTYSTVQQPDEDDSSTISSKASYSSVQPPQTTNWTRTTTNSNSSNSIPSPQQQQLQQGFCLVSRETPAIDALLALLRVAAPNKVSQSVRLWSKQVYHLNTNSGSSSSNSNSSSRQRATAAGDDYELADLTRLAQEKVRTPAGDDRPLTVQEWVDRHCSSTASLTTTTTNNNNNNSSNHNQIGEYHVLVETRRTTNSPWPRQDMELEHHIQVGDFCDAQDVTGKWYEAVVRHVDADTVTVHYAGWASRWDARLRRARDGPVPVQLVGSSSKNIQAPAPLWTQTGRWRERLQVGDAVEIRDSSSMAQRPKWYKGEIKKIGPSHKAAVPELTGGAELELYGVPGDATGRQQKLLILNRTQQVLVEVEQERTEKAGAPSPSPVRGLGRDSDSDEDGLVPRPPYLRWVDLYGEEICQINTHLREGDGSRPVTLRYEYETHRKPVEIMKTFHTPGFVRESLRGTPPAPGSVGLQNLGNSCFLNSTIQCLNHIEPLTQYFLKDRHIADLNRANPLGSGGNVACAYASLLKKMWGGDYSILAPRLLKQTVASFAPQFDNSYQHDSQEFCQFLMDGLHEDLNRVKTKPYVEELEGFGMQDDVTSVESWRKHLLRHDSIIVDHCQGMHRSHLTCPHCGRESIKFDVYSSISLPLVTLKDQKTIDLEDCLEKFMEGEQLDERNAWYCPTCRKHVCALKMIALWSVPDILILHLKRFTFDTCMISGGMLRNKVDIKVEFPIEGLDLTKNVLGPVDKDAPPIYRLFGVSEHTGPTANSGHYTATVRNSIDGQWYRCNDSHVGQTSGEASITGGAYVLLFQRTKGLSKWGGMAKVMEERGIDPYGGLETDQEGFTKVKAKKKTKGKKS